MKRFIITIAVIMLLPGGQSAHAVGLLFPVFIGPDGPFTVGLHQVEFHPQLFSRFQSDGASSGSSAPILLEGQQGLVLMTISHIDERTGEFSSFEVEQIERVVRRNEEMYLLAGHLYVGTIGERPSSEAFTGALFFDPGDLRHIQFVGQLGDDPALIPFADWYLQSPPGNSD